MQRIETADLDEYRALLPGRGAQLTLSGPGPFAGTVEAGRVGFAALRRGLSTVAHSLRNESVQPASFTFAGLPRSRLLANGVVLPERGLIHLRPGSENLAAMPAGEEWWCVFFEPERFAAATAAVFGTPREAPRVAHLMVSAGEVPWRRLLAEARNTLCPAAGPADAERLLLAVLACLPPAMDEPREAPSSARRRAVAEGLVALADAAGGEPISLIEVCGRLGTPLRTLNSSVNAILGMSAAAYLRRRRLHGAREALRSGAASSVTEAATRFGFYELGRFAVEYRRLFGESPRETLRRPTRPGLRLAA